ncbi:predicted coding region [Mycoplasmopsis pulmonis]|uniref:Uncharacterized protein n=1 Tax=Mycoplasmopsis pulmonis (strain UAB CTIP) TaxID=272635 RepID=Q98PQ9_MYCPU|nr:YhcH/YjgK/YiaL family protein [Mycoplasmopsis pulmonis]MDZ7293680.1 YhcH/YjgK/YiaL family protein [Mycoplasmopsis pulmonis]CAC13833.1 predicted coding region [Mycoplasmopsis pulmonis]VEU68426.1 beta-galactosidase-like protein [Mycoplasmopsis pulmonis]
MIVDKLNNLNRYKNIHPNLDFVINWLKENSLDKLVEGKTLLKNDDVFVVKVKMDGYNLESGLYEVHKKYADLHIVVDPREDIYYAQEEELKNLKKEFDTAADIKLYALDTTRNKLSLNSNEFVFFFPGEAHGPKMIGENEIMDKIIFKIKMGQ